jgi:hypothetical protein
MSGQFPGLSNVAMISVLQKDNFFMGEESNNYSGEPSFGGSSCVGLFLSTHPYHLIKKSI